MKKQSFIAIATFVFFSWLVIACGKQKNGKIDRYALVERNNPKITEFEELSSLSVGNGNFACTVDATGLQTFPELYSAGVPLGTQSQWGWHSFPNGQNFKPEETLKNYDFRGWDEPYAVQFNEPGRQQDAANYFRVNPHRLHLGYVGLELTNGNGEKIKAGDIRNINQTLDLWNGAVVSKYDVENDSVLVKTAVHPNHDQLAVTLGSALIGKKQMGINFRFPYPTGNHVDDATDWTAPQKHKTEIVSQNDSSFVLKRTLDSTVYYVSVKYQGKAVLSEKEAHYFILRPVGDTFSLICEFTDKAPAGLNNAPQEAFGASSRYWTAFWEKGGAVDFPTAPMKGLESWNAGLSCPNT
ncbi:MAG: hypothetical protein QM786_12105 [Breznakibacter sp.]